jgi:hypothetical protein
MRQGRHGANLLDNWFTKSAHLPVVSHPNIDKPFTRPHKALPVPKRAKGRRVAPRVRAEWDHPLTFLPNEIPPVPKLRRPPHLKIGKRVRPTWQPEVETNNTATATEPRLKHTTEHGPMFEAQGRKLMSPAACVSFHPFSETLSDWETGVPVDCGDPWAWETIVAAVEKGAHKSATSDESIALIAEDVAYQVKAGYAEVVLWEDLCQHPPQNLKVSPLAVVPQRDRRGRMILDLSFAVRRGCGQRGRKRSREGEAILQASVNDTTVRIAPEGPVKELGNVLPRILDFMATVPSSEHIHFSKMDLADGYWRMIVEPDARWNFAYVMPSSPGEPVRLVIPRALQMGWNESPAYFCATTETARDVAQTWVDSNTRLDEHPMEGFTTPTTPAKRQAATSRQQQMSAVYVDDFCLAAVEDASGTLLQRTARATLHAIHSIFPPPHVTGTPDAKDPISEKKLAKGDARWNTRKEILGYWLDGVHRTIQLPPSRAEALLKEVKALLKKKRIPLKRFRSIAGRLQHAARILPAAKAFFTPLNNALKGAPAFVGLSRHSEVRHALLDFAVVIRDLASRPTHVNELVQQDLHYTGYCDASAFGAGGVWFGAGKHLPPMVWRVQWPTDITNAVVSTTNPKGHLTNSDLELAGVLLQEAVLEATLGPNAMQDAQTAIGCDNSPAVSWTTRMATRSASPISFRLLRGLAMRQRLTKSAPPAIFHVAGVQNILADVASRPVKGVASHFHLLEKNPSAMCPDEFLTIFNSKYPLPQDQPWTSVQPPFDLWSSVISTLRGQRLPLRQWTTTLDQRPGKTGPIMPESARSTPGCDITPSRRSRPISLPLPPGFALASSGTQSKLDTNLWKKRCVTWRKPCYWLDTTIPDEPMAPKSSTCPSGTSSKAIKTKTQHLSPNLPSR